MAVKAVRSVEETAVRAPVASAASAAEAASAAKAVRSVEETTARAPAEAAAPAAGAQEDPTSALHALDPERGDGHFKQGVRHRAAAPELTAPRKSVRVHPENPVAVGYLIRKAARVKAAIVAKMRKLSVERLKATEEPSRN